MKWVEIGIDSSTERFSALSEYLKENNLENELDFVEATPSEFEEKLHQCMEKYDAIRIGRGLGEVVVGCFKHKSATMSLLKSADSLVKVDDRWWLRSATYHSLQKKLSQIGEQLDLDSSVLVVGAGAMARVAVASFVKIGFKKFNISNKFDDQANELIKEFKRVYFSVDFNFVPKDELILLPGTNGVLVNTTPLSDQNDILDELYYFNFLKSGGIAMDFVVSPPETPLLKEAQDIGVHTVKGYEIASLADIIWAEWCFNVKLDHLKYQEKLLKKVSKTS